jgi:hypothetical protein
LGCVNWGEVGGATALGAVTGGIGDLFKALKVANIAKSAGQLGREGEAAVRAAQNIGSKSAIEINGRTRIPDGLTDTILSEVKNVDKLSFTRQLRDYSDFSQQTGRSFDLYTRPGTQLSGPLQDAIDSGFINHLHIP